MKTSIQKGKEGEEFVNDLAYKSFFKYWCYPNPKDESGDKKEICDLLVLFKDICLIISVKNYKDSGNIDRHIKKTVKKSVSQIAGAERKLFNYNREIFIQHPDRKKEKFEKDKYKSIYRIAINVGEIVDFQLLEAKTKSGNYVTVLDREVFEIAMEYLDTIADFIKYLEKREELLGKLETSLLLGAEKDLLAMYLENQANFPKEILEADAQLVILDLENKWDDFEAEFKERIKEKKKEELASRAFDEYIETRLLGIENGPEVAKEFLSMNRFQRRLLSNTLLEFVEANKERSDNTIALRYFSLDNFGISFLFHGKNVSNENFLDVALQSLMIKSAQLRNYEEEHLLGISIDNQGEFWKVKYIPSREVTSEIEKYTDGIVEELGWFKNQKNTSIKTEEYP
ncbi:MAG: hypothetical protein R2830_27095, partial [Saprospiraceae bacterium]